MPDRLLSSRNSSAFREMADMVIRKARFKSKSVRVKKHLFPLLPRRRVGYFRPKKLDNPAAFCFHGSRIKELGRAFLSRGIFDCPRHRSSSMGVQRNRTAGWLGNGMYFGDRGVHGARFLYDRWKARQTRLMASRRPRRSSGKMKDYHKITYGFGRSHTVGIRQLSWRGGGKPGTGRRSFDDDEFVIYTSRPSSAWSYLVGVQRRREPRGGSRCWSKSFSGDINAKDDQGLAGHIRRKILKSRSSKESMLDCPGGARGGVTPTNSGGRNGRRARLWLIKNHLGAAVEKGRPIAHQAALWRQDVDCRIFDPCVPTGAGRCRAISDLDTDHGSSSNEDVSDTLNVRAPRPARRPFRPFHTQNESEPASIRSVSLPGLGAPTLARSPAEICARSDVGPPTTCFLPKKSFANLRRYARGPRTGARRSRARRRRSRPSRPKQLPPNGGAAPQPPMTKRRRLGRRRLRRYLIRATRDRAPL